METMALKDAVNAKHDEATSGLESLCCGGVCDDPMCASLSDAHDVAGLPDTAEVVVTGFWPGQTSCCGPECCA